MRKGRLAYLLSAFGWALAEGVAAAESSSPRGDAGARTFSEGLILLNELDTGDNLFAVLSFSHS